MRVGDELRVLKSVSVELPDKTKRIRSSRTRIIDENWQVGVCFLCVAEHRHFTGRKLRRRSDSFFFAEHRGLARSRYSYGTLLSATEGSKLPGKQLQGRDRCLAQEADVTQVNIAVDDRQRLATQM